MQPPLNLKQWLAKIEGFHPKDIDLGLEPSRQVLSRLINAGMVQTPFIITLGGTNGKGTTLQLLENAARAANLKVASYTSPHLFLFNERLRIRGEHPQDHEFIEVFEQLEFYREDVPLTYYEFTTLACVLLMSRAGVDLWLLEVGLGGRLDTVNLFDANIAVLTSIGLDHQQFLGETREAIGLEKIHIARPDGVVFIGGSDVPNTVCHYVKTNKIRCFDYSTRKITPHFDFGSLHDQLWNLALSTGEVFQNLPWPKIPLANAALGLQVWSFAAKKMGVDQDICYKTLVGNTTVFGRFTHWLKSPEVILDAAHNAAAAELLSVTLQRLPKKTNCAVFAVMADKDIRSIVKPMIPLIDIWWLWPLDVQRALAPSELRSHLLKLGVPSDHIHMSPLQSMNLNVAIRYLVFGSFFTLESFVKAADSPSER